MNEVQCLTAQHAAVRKVLQHHGLTVHGDAVVEADLIAALTQQPVQAAEPAPEAKAGGAITHAQAGRIVAALDSTDGGYNELAAFVWNLATPSAQGEASEQAGMPKAQYCYTVAGYIAKDYDILFYGNADGRRAVYFRDEI